MTNLQKNGIIEVCGGVVDMDIKSWADHIIEIYNKTETADVYNRRSNNESKNIKTVLKAINSQNFKLNINQNKTDFVHLLKAADSISLDVGTNYLEQFLQLPDVQNIINEKLNANNLIKVEQRAKDNEQKGTLPNFPKTVAETDKNAANIYLSSDSMLKGRTPEQEMARFDTHISDILKTGIFSVKTDATALQDITLRQNLMLRLGRVMLRQQGMNPGSMEIEDGKVFFQMDVPDKEPIFHGMRQEQGMSIAQQEEMIKKQEEEKRHQQELKKQQDDREKQTQENNKYSQDDQKKRDDIQRKNEEKRLYDKKREAVTRRIAQNQSSDYKSKAKLFADSLRCNVENTNRAIQSQNQAQTQRHSKGMGMGR